MNSEQTWQEAFGLWPHELHYRANANASTLGKKFKIHRSNAGLRLICSDGKFYSYSEGVWRGLSDDEIKVEIRKTNPNTDVDVIKVRNMVHELKISCHTNARPFYWLKEPTDAPDVNDLVLCANGILDVDKMKLRPLTPAYFATGTPEWRYDPKAKCPKWLAFLNEVLEPSYHPTLQEWFGYALTPDTRFEKMAVLIGASRGGKGTTIRVLEELIGKAHRSSIGLNDMAGDFGLESTLDKRLLVIPDASDTEVNKRSKALEKIKGIVGNDGVSVNRKNLKQLDGVKLRLKLTLVANKHPKFIDESSALAIRELVFLYQQSFEGRVNPNLKDELIAELSGIANWALEGLHRLRKQRAFTIGKHGKAAREAVAAAQSPALRYSQECIEVTGDPTDIVPVSQLFEAYEQWADDERLRPNERRNRTDFATDLEAALQGKGVRYATKQIRWHDPYTLESGEGRRIKARFSGLRLTAKAHHALPDEEN